MTKLLTALLILASTAAPAAAGGLAHFETPASPSRDANMNKVMMIGARMNAAAVANSFSITQNGRGNTVIVHARQHNAGSITAGASLNGNLNF